MIGHMDWSQYLLEICVLRAPVQKSIDLAHHELAVELTVRT
jgi:hypothetical protein